MGHYFLERRYFRPSSFLQYTPLLVSKSGCEMYVLGGLKIKYSIKLWKSRMITVLKSYFHFISGSNSSFATTCDNSDDKQHSPCSSIHPGSYASSHPDLSQSSLAREHNASIQPTSYESDKAGELIFKISSTFKDENFMHELILTYYMSKE